MFVGMFGSIFLLSQFLQNVIGYSPTEAGLRMLPWTGMPMIAAPDRRFPLRPDRRPAGRRHRPRAPGHRPRLVRRDHLARRVVRGAAAGADHQRHRHGAVLRAGRQPGDVQRRGPPSRASPPARTTRCGRSAARSASRCWPRSSPRRAGTGRRGPSSTASARRCGLGAGVVAVAADRRAAAPWPCGSGRRRGGAGCGGGGAGAGGLRVAPCGAVLGGWGCFPHLPARLRTPGRCGTGGWPRSFGVRRLVVGAPACGGSAFSHPLHPFCAL